jgi:hypothetical protein
MAEMEDSTLGFHLEKALSKEAPVYSSASTQVSHYRSAEATSSRLLVKAAS